MSNGAKISALGLYEWDSTIWDLMSLPTGLDRPLVYNNIMLETSDFEIIYPNPVLFKSYLGIWSGKRLPSWQRIFDVLNQEYDPLENYRRTENRSLERHEQNTATTTNNSTDTTAAATNKQQETTGNNHSTSDTTENESGSISAEGENNRNIENQVAAFNSSDYAPRDKSLESGDYEDSQTTSGNARRNTRTSADTASIVIDNETLNNTLTKTGTVNNQENNNAADTENILAFGNIGVTTSQQMLEQEINVAKHNMIQIITEDFIKEFCVAVY